MEKEMLYIGMDLGTFKTSVASSTGAREVLYTAVGWPKDHVAHRMLGRDVVFGRDIVDQRLALNVVRPFEKGVLKYLDHEEVGLSEEKVAQHKEAAKLLVEHAVSLTKPAKGMPVHGVIGAPARASVAKKQVLLEAARDAFDAVVIVSEPFAVAYGMNCLSDTLVIDIGAGTVDICPLYGTFPADEDQLTLPIGGDFIDEEFYRRLGEAYPEVQLSRNMAREIKEKHGFVHDANTKVVVSLPANGKPRPFDLTVPLKEACQTIARPIVEGVQSLVARFDPEFQQRLLKNIVLCGGGSQLKGLDTLLEEALKEYGTVKVTRVYDAVFAGAFGALKLAMNMPPEYWNRLKNMEVEMAAA
jgi:rod shape-determining protein MreB